MTKPPTALSPLSGELPGAASDATGEGPALSGQYHDDRPAPIGGVDGEVLDYIVSVNARDDEDAAARVRTALEAHGSFSAFTPAES